MSNFEGEPRQESSLEQKEGQFHGGVRLPAKELLGVGNLEVPEGKYVITSLILTENGEPKIKKGIYDRTKAPKNFDIADFDYDDSAVAEYYDNDPEISLLDIDPARAEELLAALQTELEAEMKEFEVAMNSAEDEIGVEKIEMAQSPVDHELEQVKKMRENLRKSA